MQDKSLVDIVIEDHQDKENIAANDENQGVVTPKKSEKRSPSLNDLQFIRIFDPIHIPSYLVEQLKDRVFEVDKFYDYQKMFCVLQTSQGTQLNPTNLLYVLINEKLKQVKGFLWMAIDLLTNSLIVNNFSMDKEYWHKGEATFLLETKAKKVMKDLSLKRIVWITKTPKFCEARGFKRSKDTVMIYEE